MIFLFCNHQYGFQFIQTAEKYANKNKVALTLVFSDQKTLPKSPLKNLVARTRHIFQILAKKTQMESSNRVSVVFSNNINSKAFKKSIPKRSHGIVAGFNQIFHKDIISRFESLVNFHPSVLPYYRGPVPSYWCIYNGENNTGFTLHQVTEEIDRGRVLFQGSVHIEDGVDESALDQDIALIACPILKLYLDHIVLKTTWKQETLRADEIYNHHISYLSFPDC